MDCSKFWYHIYSSEDGNVALRSIAEDGNDVDNELVFKKN